MYDKGRSSMASLFRMLNGLNLDGFDARERILVYWFLIALLQFLYQLASLEEKKQHTTAYLLLVNAEHQTVFIYSGIIDVCERRFTI